MKKMKKNILLILALMIAVLPVAAGHSHAVVSKINKEKDVGTSVWNFNPEWRFHLGDAKGAEAVCYNDCSWAVVSTPHSVKLEPSEASGCRNYQGIAWYRKHFTAPGNHLEVYFEAIMGKQKIYVNGKLATEHYGGYLPVTVELDKFGVKKGDSCLIAVMADNSDDKSYPPGKPQTQLDFAYHGGIYRDVWLYSHHLVRITDEIEANKPAGGGIFVHYAHISEKSAQVFVNTDIYNGDRRARNLVVEQTLEDAGGETVKRVSAKLTEAPGMSKTIEQHLFIRRPHLWSPESPYLYTLYTVIKDGKTILDRKKTRIGIRSFEFRGKDGFWLNGKKYRQFVGANRHQDFAYVGNAVPNSQQWRDVVRLKNCGFNMIRTAHYPQDPAFMDACDELGMFIIVATPGWQYWNKKDPKFEERVYQNTREIIRRDRNHPCVLMWEPILNETRFPEEFALKSLQITREEYPYPYRPCAVADVNSAGVRNHYDVVYGWPGDDEKANRPRQCILTREFGEYVDDWYAQNCINRASRSWGEKPMLVQAMSLAHTTEEMYHTTGQFIGGCQWHPFDHQRGYHPDPYWGGDYDAFRQPKTVYYFFHSQIPVSEQPNVYIANEMTQFSDSDVVVFSNCDSVRLSIYDTSRSWTLPVRHNADYHAPTVFKNVWNFWEARDYSYFKKNWQKVNMVAEGIVNGKVVCSMKRMPSRRSNKLRLYVDELGKKLVADGSDFIVVVCEVTDDSGNVRRLAKENIRFTVTGEGHIIGNHDGINANPRAVEWGSAPVLIRSTRKAGKIHVHAEVQYPGLHAPEPADIDIWSIPYKGKFCFMPQKEKREHFSSVIDKEGSLLPSQQITDTQRQQLLKEVSNQQADFGITK